VRQRWACRTKDGRTEGPRRRRRREEGDGARITDVTDSVYVRSVARDSREFLVANHRVDKWTVGICGERGMTPTRV